MTNEDIQKIYKANVDQDHVAALRAVYCAGWYEGAGVVPKATSPDKSRTVAAPVAIVKTKHSD